LFDVGFYSSKTFKTPTICVGNLSVGGTGKTPMIEFLVRLLSPEKKVAVLSRGYGRKSKGFQSSGEFSTVEILGDEPFQIHAKFPEISVAVDADRSNGITILENTVQPTIILLDDAFQHRKVKPTFSILLTAYNSLYVEDWYLPTGNLRDSKIEAKRADVIVVTKCPETISEIAQQRIIQKLKPLKHQKVLFSFLKYDTQLKGNHQSINLSDLKTKQITLVTGIAKPEPLVQFLEKNDINLTHLKYRDHHFFSEEEIAFFNTKEFVLTTEKDYVRLKGKVQRLYYIAIEHLFIRNGKQVLADAIRKIF
jgi:tetraacyldisaccharide 4'-kinase